MIQLRIFTPQFHSQKHPPIKPNKTAQFTQFKLRYQFQNVIINIQQQKINKMNKCQHGEKITTFCASECCVWKEAAGCQNCIKKYHNHMGTTVFLNEEDVVGLVKKYTMDSSIKPKCRILQEAIYAYFNLIKNQLSSSLDAACKNIINQIGYPYLYTNSTLSTYKRLKNKEYKKLVQKDFRALYELSQKISEKELAKEEAKIYVNEMRMTEDLIHNLEDLIKKYQKNIKKYHPAFNHDNTHIVKINEIFRNLSESPRGSQHKSREEKKPSSPVYPFKEKSQKLDKSDSIRLEPVGSSLTPSLKPAQSVQPERTPAIGMAQGVSRPNYSRDVSLDKKIVKQHRFLGHQQQQSSVPSKDSSREVVASKEKSERMEVVRQELNNKEQEINEKKKMLMEMMKSKPQKPESKEKEKEEQGKKGKTPVKQEKTKKDSFQDVIAQSREQVLNTPKVLEMKKIPSRQIEVNLKPDINITTTKHSELTPSQTENKSSSNQESSSRQECLDDPGKGQIQNRAFTQLPFEQKVPQVIEQLQPIQQKLIVIPTTTSQEKQSMECHSPLYKIKNILDKYKDVSNMTESRINRILNEKEKTAVEKEVEKDVDKDTMLELIPIYHKKSDTQMELKEAEEKSLALLLKSLRLKAEEATVYLQKAIAVADNNLSAAEYLSFLYLQLEKPTDCLKLCNKMLQKLQSSSQPEELSLILNNNKAAALNVLGRYSESIVLLQKCLRYRQKDYFYKNLGDAYFSISIYEKAIYSYEKALKLNDHNDEAHYNLAVCLYIQENYHNAKLAILKAIEINSSNENYHELSGNIDTRMNNY